MRVVTLLALGASVALPACAPTAAGDGAAGAQASTARPCFSVQEVRNFRQGDTGRIYVRAARDQVYELSSAGGCLDLDYAYQMAILPDGIGGSRLCTGDMARVYAPGGTGPSSPCRVRITRQLAAEEVAALPESHRP